MWRRILNVFNITLPFGRHAHPANGYNVAHRAHREARYPLPGPGSMGRTKISNFVKLRAALRRRFYGRHKSKHEAPYSPLPGPGSMGKH